MCIYIYQYIYTHPTTCLFNLAIVVYIMYCIIAMCMFNCKKYIISIINISRDYLIIIWRIPKNACSIMFILVTWCASASVSTFTMEAPLLELLRLLALLAALRLGLRWARASKEADEANGRCSGMPGARWSLRFLWC